VRSNQPVAIFLLGQSDSARNLSERLETQGFATESRRIRARPEVKRIPEKVPREVIVISPQREQGASGDPLDPLLHPTNTRQALLAKLLERCLGCVPNGFLAITRRFLEALHHNRQFIADSVGAEHA
jgi:hypothetical protein